VKYPDHIVLQHSCGTPLTMRLESFDSGYADRDVPKACSYHAYCRTCQRSVTYSARRARRFANV
jgi:hypothetical protein